jgi:hypothetical protein
MFIAIVLFVIAALIAGQVILKSWSYLPFVFGAFAAVAAAWTFP